eukprot:302559_1
MSMFTKGRQHRGSLELYQSNTKLALCNTETDDTDGTNNKLKHKRTKSKSKNKRKSKKQEYFDKNTIIDDKYRAKSRSRLMEKKINRSLHQKRKKRANSMINSNKYKNKTLKNRVTTPLATTTTIST